MRDGTDFLLRMVFNPSTLLRMAHLEGWGSCAGGMDVLLGLSLVEKAWEHLQANERTVLTLFRRPCRGLGLPMWMWWW